MNYIGPMTLIAFENIPIAEQREPMVSLGDFPFICVPVYHKNGWADSPDMFLRQGLAERLLRAQEQNLAPKGLRWIIFDAWRSREVQANIYQYYWDKHSAENPDWSADRIRDHTGTFVTVPSKSERIPPHATGGSVDLGLYDSTKNLVVSMGADFDEFTPKVRSDYFEQPGHDQTIRDLRRLMRDALAGQNITGDEDEYFHQDYGNQKWAVTANRPAAPYGEVIECRMENGKAAALYGADYDAARQAARLKAIEGGLTLAHPSRKAVKPLPVPALLVAEKMAR